MEKLCSQLILVRHVYPWKCGWSWYEKLLMSMSSLLDCFLICLVSTHMDVKLYPVNKNKNKIYMLNFVWDVTICFHIYLAGSLSMFLVMLVIEYNEGRSAMVNSLHFFWQKETQKISWAKDLVINITFVLTGLLFELVFSWSHPVL